MKITNQDSPNECGVCVINSLINYFYHRNNKNELLNNVTIGPNGMNVFEFESLCFKYHLTPESYEITTNELKELDINEYFVILLTSNNINHYVIARKNKDNKLTIYDSTKGIYELSYDDLEKQFLNIMIKIHKSKDFKKFNLSEKYNLSSLNVKYILVNVFLQLIIASLSICFGLFINYILDLCTNSESVKTLFVVCFIFILMSLMHH